MKREPYVLVLTLLAVTSLWATGALLAQSVGVHVVRNAEDKRLQISITPAAEPKPALKYQLLPRFMDCRAGNAAVDYGKVTAEQAKLFSDSQWWEENYSKKIKAPLADLRGQDLELHSVFDSLDRAARRTYCDWQVPVREGFFFEILIPEAQQMRAFARLLAVQARMQIASGKFEEAIRTLQTGYSVGQHVAQGPTLVHGLVGIAVCNMMSQQVQELIQLPDAPNLYWALTTLPQPLVNMDPGVKAEMDAVYLSFPELGELDDPTRSPEYWRDLLLQFSQKHRLMGIGGGSPFDRPEFAAAMSIRGYPMAKRKLVEMGRSPEEVEAMPVAQVVLIYTMQTYEELRDDMFKWWYVPHSEAVDGMQDAEYQLKLSSVEGREIVPLASSLLPAITACRSAIARDNREIAALRTVEALRLYADANQGKLPDRLDDLTVPVPIDPLTGEPFVYRLDRKTAILEGPPMPGLLLRLEVTVAR